MMGKAKAKAMSAWKPQTAGLKASTPRRLMPQDGRAGRSWSRKPSTGVLSPKRSGSTTAGLLSTSIKMSSRFRDCYWFWSIFIWTRKMPLPPSGCKWIMMLQECSERLRLAQMILHWWLLLGAAGLPLVGCAGSSSHSLSYFYTAVREAGLGLSQFFIMEYVDDQLTTRYDRDTRRYLPRLPWLKQLEDDDYWDSETLVSQNAEQDFRVNLVILQNRYNQSEGVHTLQWMYGCKLSEDGRKGGYMQYAYNGMDFISLDEETLTWTAADIKAQVTKRKLEAEPSYPRYLKNYLEKDCIERLQKYQDYWKGAVWKQEPPTVTVTRKVGRDGLETFLCRAHGFYPKEIDATWKKDGEVWEHETLRGGVTPNSDGTYHTWLSIEIDPKERNLYQCHVEHDGLSEPLDLAWEEPVLASISLIVGAILVVMAAILMLAGIILYLRKRKEYGYKATASHKDSSGLPGKEVCLWREGCCD
ncbi:class I histocompatibility antigen, F10 alpha chain-like isoform X2 [Hemicordylus capensis]|uniref:class I histocompatibility antigen, F10 alpha chain-like isoform X2 n=1 Tax=Hemicordylus capensis TaxID=884348 RepID=UPI002303A144|nr:class I histocompatibility antigen, F10 alpha chain-like isoform X2 [Hemicordylus capensis]